MQNTRMYDWSDLRLFLAVARAGSTLGAAKALAVNQTTVSRRMQALERALGLTLFERRTRGYRLTDQGKALVPLAERVEKAATNLALSVERMQRSLSGIVRLTSAEMIASRIVIPIAAEFQQRHPEVLIELLADDARLDILHGEADVAIRAGFRPEDPRLIARRLPYAAWALYCSRAYARRNGTPGNIEEIAGHDLLGYSGNIARHPGYKWFIAHADRARVVSYSNTVPNMIAVLRSGLGIGILPCFVGDPEDDLLRCFDPLENLRADIWLVTSEKARAAPPVRAFIDFAVPRIQAWKDRLAGKG